MNYDVMFKISYGLYLISAKSGDKDNGCITNTVVQITSTPNRISVCINKQNYTCEMILKSKKFNISTLTTKTPFELFYNFGYQSGKTVDKFELRDNIKRSANGIIFEQKYSNSYLSATVYDTIDLGTHIMFLADVTDGEILSQNPSVTYDYYSNNIKPAPPSTTTKGYRCKICGYIYEGEPLPQDFICPICKHGASDFEKL